MVQPSHEEGCVPHGARAARPGRTQVVGDIGRRRGWLFAFNAQYREYCRARLTEMRKQRLISPERHEVSEAICDKDAVGAGPTSHMSGGEAALIALCSGDPRRR